MEGLFLTCRIRSGGPNGRTVEYMFWYSHEEELGDELNEESPNPGRHFVRRGFPVVDIEYDRRDED